MFPREFVPFLKENSLFFGEVVFFPWGTIMSPRRRSLNLFFSQKQLCLQGEGVDVIPMSNLCLFLEQSCPLGKGTFAPLRTWLFHGSNSSLAPSRTWFKPISPSRT